MKMNNDTFNEIVTMIQLILKRVNISTIIDIPNIGSQIINTKNGLFDLDTNEIVLCENYVPSFNYIIIDSIDQICKINDELPGKLSKFLIDNESWINGEITLMDHYDEIKSC